MGTDRPALDEYTRIVHFIHMKRTNVVLDEAILAEAQRVTGLATIRAVVDAGMRELIAKGKRKRILDLKGRIRWSGDLDRWRRDG